MTAFPSGAGPVGGEVGSNDQRMHDYGDGGDMLPSAGDHNGLTPAMRQRVDGEVKAAGNPNQVVAVLRARIADIDAQNLPDDDPGHMRNQAERALAVAEISYLEERHGADPRTKAARASNTAAANAPAMSSASSSAVMHDFPDEDSSGARIYDRKR